jgi:hypothetical protein
MFSSPNREGNLSYEEMVRAIDELNSLNPMATVVWAGGEPTLLGNKLLDAISYAYSLGISTRVVTNVSWAVNEKKAKEKLIRLREAGLNELNISADDYHLPFIPFQNVINAWNASKGLGFASVSISISYGKGSLVTPEWVCDQLNISEALIEKKNNKTPRSYHYAEVYKGTVFMVSAVKIQKIGRANEALPAEEFDQLEVSDLEGGCQFIAVNPAISPNNELLSCCGFEAVNNEILNFGDLNKNTAKDIYSKVYMDPIVQAISQRGPKFLHDFVKEKAPHIPWKENYSGVCEVCEDVTSRKEVVEVLNEHKDELGLRLIFNKPAQQDVA